MKKKPIYLYILLFFSTVGTLTSAVSTFGASKSFELTDDCKTTWFNNGSRQG
ncbi:MAG: hypothetical protein ACLSFK_08210 [Streptococcus salivarius]